MTLNVVTFYGIHPVDLEANAAVPRLHALLLRLLKDAHPDWEFLAISPEAKDIPGVKTVGVELSSTSRARLRAFDSRLVRRIYGANASSKASFTKSLWAEEAAAKLARSRPDHPSTVVICTHAEAVLAVRKVMGRVQILHWIQTPVAGGCLEANVATDVAVVPSIAVYRDSWRRLGNQFAPPIWVIPNWIQSGSFEPTTPLERESTRSELGLHEDDFVIAFIGRSWIKGGQVLERALLAIPPVGKRIVVLSAGDPRPQRRPLGPDREVRNLGLLRPAELKRLYRAADLGAMPSVTEESFGLAAVEMMASGLPVIASAAGGLNEVIEDGVTGRLVDPPNDLEAWVDAIVSLLSDPDARRNLSSAGRSAVMDRFTSERVQELWDRVFSQLEAAAGPDGQ